MAHRAGNRPARTGRKRASAPPPACQRRRHSQCAPADLELREGGVGAVGVPGATVSLQKVAQAARHGWENTRPQGVEAGLEKTHYWQPPTVTRSYAVHVAIVEVDRETGRVDIDNYVVAHDCGVVVNPMLVEGQIMGGTVAACYAKRSSTIRTDNCFRAR